MTSKHKQARQKAVLVTGASSGIGVATAQLLARQGLVAFAGVRTDADATKVAALHENIRPVYLDVTDRNSIESAAQAVVSSGLSLLGIVNNAGVAVGGPLEFLPLDELRRQFEVNLFGAVAVAQIFLPQLREQRGRIVFVGSVSGRVAWPFEAPYSASKFALRAVADAMRVELAPAGVSVSIVEPGSVKTPIWRKARESKEEVLRNLGGQGIAYYSQEVEAVFRGIEREERNSMPVERVSTAIFHALTARKPRARYAVGSRLAIIFEILPAGLRDRLLRASLRRM